MTNNSFAGAIFVDESPVAVFDAVKRPREWWGA